jgi:hypothetical protein
MHVRLDCILLALCIGLISLAGDSKQEPGKTKEKAKAEQRENRVEKGAAKSGNAVSEAATETGEAVAHGSKKAAEATVKGAKWFARPWSKSKDEPKQSSKEPQKKTKK